LKTEEKIGTVAFVTVAVVAVPVLLRRQPVPPAKPAQISTLTGELVMAMPEDDSPCVDDPVLIWGSAVLQEYSTEIGADPLELYASPDNLRSTILERTPRRLYLFGHGNDSVYTCEKCEIFLQSTGLNLDLVPDRYVHLLSCLTAKDLGHKIIDAGATAYFGYAEDFALMVLGDHPGSCRYVEASFFADLEIERLLLGGETSLETIYNAAIQRFNDEIAYWEEHWDEESCDGHEISESEAQMLVNLLMHDRDSLRCYYPGGEYPQEAV
jgi:hypothetical protein